MSSNAFARSRPRQRHQRVPRGSSCDHPRFLQLVNELARINDAKRRQQDEAASQSSPPTCQQAHPSIVQPEEREANDCASAGINGIGASTRVVVAPAAHTNPQASACFDATGAQTSNGYRSLDNNNHLAAANALHDNYRQQPQHQLTQNKQHYQQQPHHHHHHHHQQHDSSLIRTDSNGGGGAAATTTTTTACNNNPELNTCRTPNNEQINKGAPNGFGFSKQNLCLEQQQQQPVYGSNLPAANSNNNLDLRQDENRSKRKRTGFESTSGLNKKNSSSSHGASCSIKRHKSLAEAVRPLSPSFTKCPICLLDTMDRDPSFTNTCFHLFCYVCIENWTKNKATCPLCRTKFTKIIFNIKSATDYNEKTASPARRDDDDGYIADRLMLEHLSGLNTNSANNRNSNSDDMQFLFENLRNPEVLMPQYFANQMDPRPGESIHPFNVVTTAATDFNSSVTHPHFAPNSYPIPPNYSIALFPSRITPTANTAIASAYTANTSLTNINSDPSSRRISRSGRYIYTRNYDSPNVETARVTRVTNSNVNSNVPFDRLHHLQQQHQHQHQPQHHQQPPSHQQQSQQQHQQPQQQQQQHLQQHQSHHHQHQHNQHRTTIDMSTSRQNQRIEQLHAIANLPLPYHIQARHYNPNVYPRRSFNNPQVDHQHLLDNLYRPTPDM